MRAHELFEISKPKEVDIFRKRYNDSELATPFFKYAASNNPEWKDSLISYMRKFGFNLVGAGFNGAVFQNSNYPYVLKVYRTDRGYDQWVKFCLSHQNNKYVPKIKGQPIKINDVFTAVRIDPLVSSKDIHGKYAIRSGGANDEFFDSYYREYNRAAEGKGSLYDDDMYEIAQFMMTWKDHTDLTRHNIMYSTNDKQIKIIDPLYIFVKP